MKTSLRPANGEAGQILVISAFAMVIVLAFAALAIDVGMWLHSKTKLQADADAMALAGAQKLPDPGDAYDLAFEYSTKNGVLPQEIVDISGNDGITINAGSCNGASPGQDHVTVRLTRTRPPFLAQVLTVLGEEVFDAEIRVCATAMGGQVQFASFVAGGFGQGVRPFALERQCIEAGATWPAIGLGDPVVIKFDAGTQGFCQAGQGNFGAIRVDGSGSSVYEHTINFGSQSPLCSIDTPGCCPTATATGCVGSYGVYLTPTETGNMIGPTRTGINYLISATPGDCNEWTEVQSDGVINPDCAPWSDEYQARVCPGFVECGTRLIIVPVVDGLWQGGNHLVTIRRFAVLFLEGFDGNCSGNQCNVRARFIKAEVNPDWVVASQPCDGEGEPACGDVTYTVPLDIRLIQ